MMMIRMMMRRSVLIQLACLALVGSANAAYDFEACSYEKCAGKSHEVCVLSSHRRWVWCSCLCALLYAEKTGLIICNCLPHRILVPVFQVLTFFSMWHYSIPYVFSKIAEKCTTDNCGQECSGEFCACKFRFFSPKKRVSNPRRFG